MSLWEWLLGIALRGLDVLLHLWQIDREMREGKWDDDAGDSSRACRQAQDAAHAGSRDDGGRDRCGGCWRLSSWFQLDIVFGLWDWATGRSRRHRTQ